MSCDNAACEKQQGIPALANPFRCVACVRCPEVHAGAVLAAGADAQLCANVCVCLSLRVCLCLKSLLHVPEQGGSGANAVGPAQRGLLHVRLEDRPNAPGDPAQPYPPPRSPQAAA
eukprot:4154912-Pleurochrysis_carterae.AAC.2